MFSHPATHAICRHCGKDAGYMDECEMCIRCGPLCADCFEAKQYPCEPQTITIVLPPKKQPPSEYTGA